MPFVGRSEKRRIRANWARSKCVPREGARDNGEGGKEAHEEITARLHTPRKYSQPAATRKGVSLLGLIDAVSLSLSLLLPSPFPRLQLARNEEMRGDPFPDTGKTPELHRVRPVTSHLLVI